MIDRCAHHAVARLMFVMGLTKSQEGVYTCVLIIYAPQNSESGNKNQGLRRNMHLFDTVVACRDEDQGLLQSFFARRLE